MPGYFKQVYRHAASYLEDTYELAFQEEKATTKYLRRKDHYPNCPSLDRLFLICTVLRAEMNRRGETRRIRIPGRSELPLVNNRT